MLATTEAKRWMLAGMDVPLLRTMREFAEQEIIIPDGPKKGVRYNCLTQPYTGLLFDAMDSTEYQRFVILGPTQSGKSLNGFIIPIMFHLFEIGETVICGVPKMDVAGDKYREDILPAIEASRYRDLLPSSGSGSRGGKNIESVKFKHGPTLKFMSGAGDDKSRAAFTSRVVIITETDGMDEASETSREADPITQLEGRTRAYGRRKRIYMECTVSTPQGRTWREYQASTKSRIVLPCPKCGLWVSPERESLQGWRAATDIQGAIDGGHFACPECSEPWTEIDRRDANRQAKLVHDGQEVTPEGHVVGEAPRTNTLGFRWSAVNNLFAEAGDLAGEEWKAANTAEDSDDAEKQQHQFVWAIPWAPPELNLRILTANHVQTKLSGLEKCEVPDWAIGLTLTIDVGSRAAHWTVKAWKSDATNSTIDYGVAEIRSDQAGGDDAAIERCTLIALLELWDEFETEPYIGPDGKPMPLSGLCDSGYAVSQLAVYEFCRRVNQKAKRPAIHPAKGYGQAAKDRSKYSSPKNRTAEWHKSPTEAGVTLVHFNADYWKEWAHERWYTPQGSPGAGTVFGKAPTPEARELLRLEHQAFARHITAEEIREEVPEKSKAGKGTVRKWYKKRRNNHWLDCDAMAGVAANGFYGVQVVAQTRQEIKQTEKPSPLTMPDGRPFLITERE